MNKAIEANQNNLKFKHQRLWNLLFAIWLIATGATFTSLFFSEIMQLPVCVLCWYQRIVIYPLVVMIPMALFPFEPKIIRFISPLIVLGWLTALFHVLVVEGVIPEAIQPCTKGIPCSEINFSLFGFLNIPIMSLMTFTLLGMLLWRSKKIAS
jgi:disulfide bond formation protein DsbB